MKTRTPRLACTMGLLAFLATGLGCYVFPVPGDTIRPAGSLPATTPWDLIALSEAPSYEWSVQDGPVHSLYYRGEPYQGNPTHVFAYYASPATLGKGDALVERYPAVVLVHGGGGTAFKAWVELWARRGYAAIAMDLGACGPGRKPMPDGGPVQTDDEKFGAIDKAPQDQWPYHGVANVILAHSLIRRFAEVDARRTAVTGISWGGYLTCIVAGLDSRFQAAVPVYGCGYLHENSAWLGRFAQMTAQQKERWVQLWDPSMYIGSARMPMFFVNGTNDFAYPLDSYARTCGLVRGWSSFRITVNMPHGHQHGWAPQEIGQFIDHHLKGGLPLPSVGRPLLNDGKVIAGIRSNSALSTASLHYTTGTTPINKLDWETKPANIDGEQLISCVVPEEATICFLTVTDSRGAIVSSELVFSKEPE